MKRAGHVVLPAYQDCVSNFLQSCCDLIKKSPCPLSLLFIHIYNGRLSIFS